MNNPYENMLSVLEDAAKMMGLSPDEYVMLKYPERELKVAIPVEMDDGHIEVFGAIAFNIPPSEVLTKAVSVSIRTRTSTKSRRLPLG